ASITRARMFADRRCVEFHLKEPAWSITRYDLDVALWRAAEQAGVVCHAATVVESVASDRLIANDRRIAAHTIINASGRWSNLSRPITQDGPRWIGVKAHFSGE